MSFDWSWLPVSLSNWTQLAFEAVSQGLDLSNNGSAVLLVQDAIGHSARWVGHKLPSTSNLTSLASLVSAQVGSLSSLLVASAEGAGFSDFQLRLCREFGFILLGNIFLVLVAWWIYGQRICDTFFKPGSSRRGLQELRNSISELKLPKEHDFKFK